MGIFICHRKDRSFGKTLAEPLLKATVKDTPRNKTHSWKHKIIYVLLRGQSSGYGIRYIYRYFITRYN